MSTRMQRKILRVAAYAVVIAFAAVGAVHSLPHLHAGLGTLLVGSPGAFASSRYIVTVTNETGGAIALRLLLLNPPPDGERSPYGSYCQQVLGYRSDATFQLEHGETRVVDLPLTSRVPHPVMVASVHVGGAFALIPVNLTPGSELVPEDYSLPGRVTASAIVRITPDHWVELPNPTGNAYGVGDAAPILRDALSRTLDTD